MALSLADRCRDRVNKMILSKANLDSGGGSTSKGISNSSTSSGKTALALSDFPGNYISFILVQTTLLQKSIGKLMTLSGISLTGKMI